MVIDLKLVAMAVVTSLVLVGSTLSVTAGQPRRKGRTRVQAAAPDNANQGGGQPRNPNAVAGRGQPAVQARDPAHEELAQKLTAAGLPAPEVRIRFFSTLYNANMPRINGWRSLITSTTAIPGGHLVAVHVTPDLGTSFDTVHIIEYWSIVNGHVNFEHADLPQQNGPRYILGF